MDSMVSVCSKNPWIPWNLWNPCNPWFHGIYNPPSASLLRCQNSVLSAEIMFSAFVFYGFYRSALFPNTPKMFTRSATLLFSVVAFNSFCDPPPPTPHPPTNTQTNSLHIHPAPSAQPSTYGSHRRSSKLRWDRHVWNTSKHNWSPTNNFLRQCHAQPMRASRNFAGCHFDFLGLVQRKCSEDKKTSPNKPCERSQK